MANHKSAEKRHRQSLTRRANNRQTKSECRTSIKKINALVLSGDVAAAKTELVIAQKLIATAASKGMYHKKNAARKISRLASAVNKVSATAKAA